MYAATNPWIHVLKVFSLASFIILPIIFMLISQYFTDDYGFTLSFVFSCILGLICSFTLLFKYQLSNFAFTGIAIHLFALSMITCY